MNVDNEKQLILATKPFAKEVRWKSWWHLFTTGVLLGAAYFGIFWPTSPLWLKVVCAILAGLLIARMFIIYHDHQHKAILQNSKFVDGVMALWGIFVLAPTSIWKRSHDHHHTHNSSSTLLNQIIENTVKEKISRMNFLLQIVEQLKKSFQKFIPI